MTGHPESGMTRGRLLVILLIVGVVIIGGLLFMQYRDRAANSPRAAGDNFVKALVAKDSSASYAFLSENFKASTPESDWKIWVDFTFDGTDGSSTFVEELTITDPDKTYPKDSTPVRYTYEYTLSGETYHFTIVLLKEKQVWKISEIGSIEQ